MSRYVYVAVFVLALVLIAAAGWAVDGARRLRGAGGRRYAAEPAPSL